MMVLIQQMAEFLILMKRRQTARETANDKRIYYGMENGIIIVDVINTTDLLSHSLLTGDDYYDYHNVNVA